MKQRNLLHAMRKNSIFAKTFFGMLLLSLTVLTVFYFSLNLVLFRHNQEEIAGGNLSLLHQSAASMEVALEALAQSMTQSMWNQDFIGYMISPSTSDQSQYYRILQQLKNSVSENELVIKALFFSNLSPQIFQDSFAIEEKRTFSDRAMLDAYLLAETSTVIKQAKTNTSVTLYRGRLFLIQELNIASPIGVLVYELNMESFEQRFFRVNDAEDQILVFTKSGEQLFPRTALSSVIHWENEQAFLTADTLSDRVADQSVAYYRYTAPTTGWNYLLHVGRHSATVSFAQILTMYLPVFLLLLVVGLVFSWYISQTIYQPINRLMSLIAQPSPSAPAGDEADFLALAYSDALDSNAQLHGMIHMISPEIIESMLNNLLIGKSLTEARILEILDGVGNPFSPTGCFFVIACALVPTENRTIHDTEVNLHLLAVRNLLARLPHDEYAIYDVRADRLTVALVCCFPSDTPARALTQEYRRIKQTLQLNSEVLPCQLLCERGNVYSNIAEIRYSLREAVEKIQYQQYMQQDQEPSPTVGQALNRSYFRQQAKNLVEMMADSAQNQAQSRAALTRLIDEISETAVDLSSYRALVHLLMDEILERVIVYPLTPEDQQALHQCKTALDSPLLVSEQQVVEAVQTSYQMIYMLISNYSRKNRYKYVDTAKEYIAASYMDPDISLNKVGDQVGISASYLSELFNELAGKKFSAYLAEYRVEKARQLLRSTTLSIKDIGYRCGFNSVQNFIRVFKKYAEETPGQYRENL